MHSGCFCYRSNNVWFWKEQGLVSFAEMKCQKCKHFGAHNTPLPYLYIYICIYIYMYIYDIYIYIDGYVYIYIYIYISPHTHTCNLVLIFCTLYNLICLGGNRQICSHMLHETMVPNVSKPRHVSMTSLARTVTQRPPQLGITCAEHKTSEWPFVAPSLTGEICHHFL